MKSKLSAALAVAGCSLSLGAALPLTVSPANADSVYNINFVDITGPLLQTEPRARYLKVIFWRSALATP